MKHPWSPRLRPSRAALALVALALASPLALVAQRHALASDPVLPAGLPALAGAAVSDDAPLASRAVAALRARGPAGLDALVASQRPAVARLRQDPVGALRDPSVARARGAIDAVAAQRDAWAEGLYWFTDDAAARAEAQRTGRMVLSLHLLGRLDEQFSCANSRLFRAVLYPDARVRDELRAHWVLAWHSERPAPRITIDMGDGRRLVRTITGNSVHYALDADGRVVDVAPGLESPAVFAAWLARTRVANARCTTHDAGAREGCLRAWHADQLARLDAAWSADGADVPARPDPSANGGRIATSIDARTAGALAVGKALVEQPMLQLMAAVPAPAQLAPDDAAWARLAATPAHAVAFDPAALPVVWLTTPPSERAAVVARLAALVAQDTLRNEQQRHRAIHAWLAAPGATRELAPVNARVYAELFLTPSSDPWLGLRADGLFTGLEDEVQASPR